VGWHVATRFGTYHYTAMKKNDDSPTKAQELRAFLVLTIITAPILAVMVVGGYGFFVWMMQLLTGWLPTGGRAGEPAREMTTISFFDSIF